MLAVTRTDVGRIRQNNEDQAYAGVRLFALADGMGGPPAGDVASDLAIRTLRPLDDRPYATGEDALGTLLRALDDANRAIRAAADDDDDRAGMGTTVTALLAADDGALALVHVGDSRAYRLRDGALEQVTRDDTYVQFLIDRGALEPEDARDHPQRALVTQAVQGGPYEPQCLIFTPRAGDRFLLCSDGLSDIVTDETIAMALGEYADGGTGADRLIALALAAGAPDNITVVVMDV